MTEPTLQSLQNELDMQRREFGFQMNGFERWIQKASATLDKVVELQVQIETTRENQSLERASNERLREELREDIKLIRSDLSEVKTKTQETAVKVTLVVGAGVTLMNVGLWLLERFL